MNTQKFDPSELSSRKLWQLVTEASGEDSNSALTQAVEELASRRQYMEKLLSSERLAQLVPESAKRNN